mmetsp:Transcript_17999/g.30648  ORF Transcript_17999/g.30648 Transcript_17999/m.30648 type:complete len:175 (+) Transcript_17999:203-727(+)|eukprot:CAMPEP_0168622558 /NCGR_PEP_ID=MMETSP0449_2-20121227/8336_1 /TAXON_ID=1082188 /ORGANISM="Strombidium rassoulzadegani, Strain ras09" /LENGTH=174 /DNA_ID=CAMNT_0008663841 /DNA_START=114 /DNA_END=638 /DNA_ORIENTATION=-
MENGGQLMIDELYKDCILSEELSLKEFNITLKIDASGVGKTLKVKKTMTEEEANEIREKNELMRKEREVICEKIASRFSSFKRDFMSAPIRLAAKGVLESKQQFKPCQIDYRKDERFWVFGTDKDLSVTFEMNFSEETDQALARIFLLELNDSKRNVMNAPVIIYHDKVFPENV